VLTLVTVVPALAFGGVFAGAYTSIREPDPIVTYADTAGASPIASTLTTDVLAFRRLPTVISRQLNVDALAAQVDPTFALLNERSCAAVSLDGEIVGEHNAELPVIPASNQKLPVAGTALELLGADFRYRTEVRAAAEPIDGVVAGDLVLVGGGDPLLSSDWYPTSALERYPVTSPTSLDELADRVVGAGIVQVTGSVLGDGSRYDDEFFAPGWGPGVAGVSGGPYDALMANDSLVFGDDVRAPDPSEGAAREFSRLLAARGVEIGGPAASGPAPAPGVEIASIESAPMTDVIAEMLLTSDNNTAEMMVKELGTIDAGPGTRAAGLEVIREQLVDWGVDVSSVVLADGSGLSLDNRLTCDALITVLQRTGFSSAVGQGLPVAGQTGTLSGIFGDHPVSGRLRGKTGTLTNPPFNVDPPAVKALAGFLPAEGGTSVEYVVVLNGPTIADESEYRPVWYAVADALDTYPGAASPADLGPR
jgi:D-alanyl-D-alanine carboxypeptidase/D-alanyl-D-alanine-endopeptidase (penicillin-binding protein 4)